MTLWSIARSPLLLGADMTRLDPFTLALLTNPEVIAVKQLSENNRQLFRTPDGLIAWVADVPGTPTPERYLAVFNTRESDPAAVPVPLADLGFTGPVEVRDLWSRSALPAARGIFAPEVPSHGTRLFRLSPAR